MIMWILFAGGLALMFIGQLGLLYALNRRAQAKKLKADKPDD